VAPAAHRPQGPLGPQKRPPLIVWWFALLPPCWSLFFSVRVHPACSLASLAIACRCHPWHPRHQCRAVLGTVLGLSPPSRLAGTSVAQALLGFRRRGDVHRPAESVRRRLTLATSYRTSNCSRRRKAPGTFRREGYVRAAGNVHCRGARLGQLSCWTVGGFLRTTRLTQITGIEPMSCAFVVFSVPTRHVKSTGVLFTPVSCHNRSSFPISSHLRASANRTRWPTLVVAITTILPLSDTMAACAARITSPSRALSSAVG
jgi:hypothetical protein